MLAQSDSASLPRYEIKPATIADAAGIGALLAAAGLPHADIALHLENFLVLRIGGELAGAVGLEIYGGDALLRSLVVAPSQRGSGTGRALVREIGALARDRGVARLYLLTTTAAEFFERVGFVRTGRGDVPASVTASKQFQGLCPSSAVCLTARVQDVLS